MRKPYNRSCLTKDPEKKLKAIEVPWGVPDEKRTNLYIIECGEGGPVKIGIAKNITGRLCDIQVSNPVKVRLLISVTRVHESLEKGLHLLYAEKRIRGEWFDRAILSDTAALEHAIKFYTHHYMQGKCTNFITYHQTPPLA